MRVRLRGVNAVRKRLSSGQWRRYYYHRASGVRLPDQPGTAEFVAAFAEAERMMASRHTAGVLAGLIRDYTRSPEFRTTLRESTQREYLRKLRTVEAEFGDMPVSALETPRVRQHFMKWRALIADESGPREADYRLSVLSALLSWAVENGRIYVNHVKGFKRLYHSNRAAIIWEPHHIDAFMSVAPVEMQQALILALHTGLRQGDLRRLSWSNYDGSHLRLRISKNERAGRISPLVAIPCTRALKTMLDGMERRQAVILTTMEGRPFTARYLGHQWSNAMRAAGLEASGLHFHDLRGTAVTMLARAGCTIPEIVAITQHSLASATRILEVYLARTQHLADQAISRLENAPATAFANQLQTAPERAVSRLTKKG